jgi:hypothetical protein
MHLLLLLSACCLLPSVSAGKPGREPGRPTSGALVRCLQDNFQFTIPHKISAPTPGSLPRIETYGAFTQPVIVLGPSTGLLLKPTPFTSDRQTKTASAEGHIDTTGSSLTSAQSLVDSLIGRGYGDEYVRWQFASGGGKELPSLSSAQDGENFMTFAEAMARIGKKRRDMPPATSIEPMSTQLLRPSFFSLPSSPSTCASEIASLLYALGNSKSSPLYAISSTTGLMDAYHKLQVTHSDPQRWDPMSQNASSSPPSSRESRNSGKGEQNRKKDHFEKRRLSRAKRREERARKKREQEQAAATQLPSGLRLRERPLSFTEFKGSVSTRKSGFVDRMVRDRFLTSGLPLGLSSAMTMVGRTVSPHGIDVYFGMAMSGSHLHAHGPAVSSSTGRKLWMLYSPSAQCELETAAGVSLLAKAGLPSICRREWDDKNVAFDKRNKFHKDSSLCLGQLHPLEVLYKLGNLEKSLRPMLVVQEPGEVMILPGRWLHTTLNLEELFTVSYRFQHPPPRNLGCPVRESRESWKADL